LTKLAATPLGLPNERLINFCVANNGADSITLDGSFPGGLGGARSGDSRKTTPIDSMGNLAACGACRSFDVGMAFVFVIRSVGDPAFAWGNSSTRTGSSDRGSA